MVTATALRGRILAVYQSRERAQSLPCSRQPGSGCHPQTAQLARPVQPAVCFVGQWHRRQTPVQLTSHAALRHSRHTAAQAFNDDAADRQRSAQGSGSQAFARGGAGSTGSRLGELVNSPFDADIFSVAVPALASIMLDAIMLLVDTAIIGRLGTAPLGAVGLSTLIFVFSNLFFNFLTVCTTSSVANAAAEKDTAEVSKATARAMFVGLICGTALVFALWTYSPLLMTLLGTTPETATLAVMYLRVRCFACPAFLLYNVGTGNFRGRKDTRTPLLAYMANNFTYVLLELLFVFGLKWGVVGAALAPAIGQYVGLAVMVGLLVREKALFAGDLGHVPTLEEVSPLLKKGLPLGAVNLLVLPVVVGCTSLVTALGVTSLAAHTIIKQVWDFWTQVSQCLNIAANSMVASALGEKDLSTARDVLLRILMMGFAPGVALGAAFLVAQSAIPAVFTQDPSVISAVTHIVPLLALAMPLIPVATVLEGALLGAVDTSYIAKRTGLGIAIALAVIYGSQSVLHMGLLGIWAGLASFLTSNTVCDTLRLMSPSSPLPVAIVPGIPDPTLNPEDSE